LFLLTKGKAVSKSSIAQYTTSPFNFRSCMCETSGYRASIVVWYRASIVVWFILLPYCASVPVSFVFENLSCHLSRTLSKVFVRALERPMPL